MNREIKVERVDEPMEPYSSTYSQNREVRWPPISSRTRSRTAEFYNQQPINQKDIFRLGKLLEQKSVFSLEQAKYK